MNGRVGRLGSANVCAQRPRGEQREPTCAEAWSRTASGRQTTAALRRESPREILLELSFSELRRHRETLLELALVEETITVESPDVVLGCRCALPVVALNARCDHVAIAVVAMRARPHVLDQVILAVELTVLR